MPMREADTTALADEKLIEMCLLSDERAWETLIKRYTNYIYAIIVRGFPNVRADDTFQECVIKLIKGLPSVENKKNFIGFVKKTVVHTCLDEYRKEEKHKQKDKKEPDYERLLPLSATSPEPQPGDEVDKLINKMVVEQALQKLPKEFHEVLILKKHAYSIDEIARKLNISPKLAGVRIHRALKKLKEILREMEDL